MTDGAPTHSSSVIEQMAITHHKVGPSIIEWDQLSQRDRDRLIAQMERTIAATPDELTLTSKSGSATVETGECRDALIEDHKLSSSGGASS